VSFIGHYIGRPAIEHHLSLGIEVAKAILYLVLRERQLGSSVQLLVEDQARRGVAPSGGLGLASGSRRTAMATIHYHIVQHDGGWAYKLGDVFSESFPTHEQALQAARRAAREQERPDETRAILWEDADGKWHEELAKGDDRPDAEVDDKA
jgi:hypothetical protein